MISRLILTFLIGLIIASAHLQNNSLYRVASFLGVDVPMTPFTSDMTLMLAGNEKRSAYYQKSFLAHIQTETGSQVIGAEELGWYEFKAPYQWFAECHPASGNCEEILYFLCRSLESVAHAPVVSWTVSVTDARELPLDESLGVEYKCARK